MVKETTYWNQLKQECCSACQKMPPPRLFSCSRCHCSLYCGVDCQRSDWPAHKKICKRQKKALEFILKDITAHSNVTSTDKFILACRLALGQSSGDLALNVKKAVELYQEAVDSDRTIVGGHPIAMLHLAIHYERGIGVEQDYDKAFDLYNRILNHNQGGEENVRPALLACSRFYKLGLGSVQVDEEEARKYAMFAQSNIESKTEFDHMLQWWDAKKDSLLPNKE